MQQMEGLVQLCDSTFCLSVSDRELQSRLLTLNTVADMACSSTDHQRCRTFELSFFEPGGVQHPNGDQPTCDLGQGVPEMNAFGLRGD